MQSSEQKSYIRTETVISMVINGAISAGFVWAVFGSSPSASVWAAGGVAFDFVPQTFMVTLMSVLVPTLLTRKRLRSGALPVERNRPSRLPRNVLLRAALFAFAGTAIFGGLMIALFAVLNIEEIGFEILALVKIVYGALVALVVTPLALYAALQDIPRAQ